MSDRCVCGSLHPADSVCVHLLCWLHSEVWLMMEEIPFENYRCFFSPTFFCLVPPSFSPSFSLSLSPSLVVFSRVARSFLDSLMENHHHTEAKFLVRPLSLFQSDLSLGLQLLLKPVVGLSEPCPSCSPPHSLPGPDEIHDQCLSRHNPRRSFCQTCVYTERNESEAADMKRASEGRSGEGGLNSV